MDIPYLYAIQVCTFTHSMVLWVNGMSSDIVLILRGVLCAQLRVLSPITYSSSRLDPKTQVEEGIESGLSTLYTLFDRFDECCWRWDDIWDGWMDG